jgi:hypothetical protein
LQNVESISNQTMAMLLRSAAGALLLRTSASAVAPIAAVAIVASRRLFSHTTARSRSTAGSTAGADDGQRACPVEKRIEETKEELLRLYLSKAPLPAAAEVATDLTGVLRRFQEAKARQHDPESFVGGEPFVGESFEGELFDTEAYEADASVAGYSFSGGTYTGGYHSGDMFREDSHPADSGDSWR